MPYRSRIRKRAAKRHYSRRSRVRGTLFIILTAFSLMTVLFVSLVDRRLMPAVIHIEEYRINARMNQAINTALAELAESSGGGRLVSEDFYVAERAPDGRITSLAANVILINEISAGLSHSLLKSLSKPVTERVSVPIGTLLGLEWLANIGPTYSIRVMPVGAANVEYNTSFTSAGINQINFQVWLTVKATMQIVNPLQSREIDVERSIPLVNTVFAGEIPEVYLWPMGR